MSPGGGRALALFDPPLAIDGALVAAKGGLEIIVRCWSSFCGAC